jgi:hypothetical protein
MHKRRLRIVLVAILGLAVAALASLNSVSGIAAAGRLGPEREAHLQNLTPTPAEMGKSQPGSTDGIVSMGIVITVIVILPIVLRKATWTSS